MNISEPRIPPSPRREGWLRLIAEVDKESAQEREKQMTHRVLLDCSYATLSLGDGMPFDTGHMLTILGKLDTVEPSAIFYDTGEAGGMHSFVNDRKPIGEKLANQALLLDALVEYRGPWSRNRLLRLLQKLKFAYRVLLSRKSDYEQLETHYFGDLIWRNFLKEGLSPDHMHEILHSTNFLLSNLGVSRVFIRGELNLPQPRINTTDYDFAIFQDSRPVTQLG